MEKMRWVDKNVLVAAVRVLKQIKADKEKVRAESMLQVCSDLIDLDATCLALKILKHVRYYLEACVRSEEGDYTLELGLGLYPEYV